MKTVEYTLANRWVGEFDCPSCRKITYAWRSSGMSESYPHFYCNRCSNVILRESDRRLIWDIKPDEEILNKIIFSLPNCECGGKFLVGTNPKCPGCGFEFKHQDDPIARLSDPHMILIDNAVLYDENGPQYRVKIIV